MHQTCLSMVAMAAFANAIGPDVLQMLGGLPVGGKHSGSASTQQAAALTTAPAQLPVASEAYGESYVDEKTDVAEDYTHIYVSSGTEVVEMASTTLYYPLTLQDAAAAAAPTDVADAAPSKGAGGALGALPLDSLPLGGLKRDSSSAVGAGGGSEDWDSFAPTEEHSHEDEPVEELPYEDEEPVEDTFDTPDTTSTDPVETPATEDPVDSVPAAPAGPLDSLPVLGGLSGGLPIKRDSSSAVGAGGGDGGDDWHQSPEGEFPEGELPEEEYPEEEFPEEEPPAGELPDGELPPVGESEDTDSPIGALPIGSLPLGGLPIKRHSSSAAGAIGGDAPHRVPAQHIPAQHISVVHTTFQTAIRSTTSAAALPVDTPAASNPLQGLPLLGGLGGLKERQLPDTAPFRSLAEQVASASAQELYSTATHKAREAFSSATHKAHEAFSSATEKAAAAAATKASSPLDILGGLLGRRQVQAAPLDDLVGGKAAHATSSAKAAVGSATKKVAAASASASKAASPLQGLPVLGGLGGLGGI